MDYAAQVAHLTREIELLQGDAFTRTWKAISVANAAFIDAGPHGQLALAYINARHAQDVRGAFDNMGIRLAVATQEIRNLIEQQDLERARHKKELLAAKKKAKK